MRKEFQVFILNDDNTRRFRMNRLFALIVAGFLLMSMCGCVAVVAGTAGGVGTATWLSGKMSQDYNVSRDTAVRAVKMSLDALKLEITKETRAEEVTQVKGKYTDGREIWIDVRKITDSSSRVQVRVGAMSDKAAAEKIMKKIDSYL